ncbi:MAG: cation transporter [Gemmatimonadales bacterium]|nr:cation transporter [Gemmatimonadales bacterium]MBP7620817.1 cation transporter [Gemmatimonadales bacterium]
MTDARLPQREGIGTARLGVLVNLMLAIFKGLAGILGNSYALIADAVESVADIAGGLVVWGGLSVAARDADHDHPYGHGKAEPLATAAVGLMLLGAALGIMLEAVREMLIPHRPPAPFTLAVLVGVVIVKETLFRRVLRAAAVDNSGTVHADAWHHRSDAITSGAAFVGISAALLGGKGWEWCDEAAAIVAAFVILANGVRIIRPAIHELMDGAPEEKFLAAVSQAAMETPGVRHIEKLRARRVGTQFDVDLHVQGDPALTLHEAHILSGIVKGRIRSSVPAVCHVLVHMEPYEPQ